jgi:hypothetical protein
MFFTQFIFTISYRPGSLNNTKADALSRLYDTEDRSIDPTPILPASRLVALVVWEVDTDTVVWEVDAGVEVGTYAFTVSDRSQVRAAWCP